MAKQGQNNPAGLDGITKAATEHGAQGKGLPPVHLWNPPFCGDLDIRIKADGSWFYLGTPIGRAPLVRLFSTVLKREGDKYFLVTPVEKIGITVDDVPFMAVEMTVEQGEVGRVMSFRTNVGDWVTCNAENRMRFEIGEDDGLVPYIHVRSDLWAKVTRALYYDVVDMGEARVIDGKEVFGVESAGEFFVMADAEQMREAP